MTISALIAPHLPYLRRFARALTGSQEGGDAYVVEVLETLIAAPASFPTDGDPRVSLYRTFLRIWNSVGVNSHATGGGNPGERSLEQLTPLPRQAFLLKSVEGFTIEEIADLVGGTSADVESLLAQAGREIAAQVATDVLIIEDEPLIAIDLEELVESLGHRVTGTARTHKEAVRSVRGRRPGLVLADIQLADGSSGLEAVNEILGLYDVPVIFITAFPERLLTGARPEPTFLITKPFEKSTVGAIISQALFFDMTASLPSQREARA